MKSLGCAPYPQTRRHPRTADGADAPHLCTSKRYDPKAEELLLGTDAVDVVVKATVARAGQIAAATENSIAEPAPSTAETSAGSSLFRCSEATQCQRLVRSTGRSRRINHSARVGNAPQQNALLFDHLVGAGEQRRWHVKAERLRAASSLVDRWNSTRPLTATAALAPDACRRRRMGGRGRASSLRDSYASPVRPLPFCSAVQLPL